MNQFALLPNEEKLAYFEVTANKLNLLPELIEKDFWVCWILKQLFSLDDIGAHLTFKGGTSLSKCYNAIQRFSEDVDVSIERSYLGYNENIGPVAGESNKENKRRLKGLQQACQTAVAQKVFPPLKKRIQEILGDGDQWAIELDPSDPDKQTLLFQFPNASARNIADYLKPIVKIELGSRSEHWPVESGEITSYLADIIPDAMTIKKTLLRVLAAERTFWEKATILHMIYHYPANKTIPPRMSRHYYDIYELSQTSIFKRALDQIELLKHVADHKNLFFKSSWAKYNEARPGTLRLVPTNPDRIKGLKADYQQMQQMFFVKPPSFDHIVKELQGIEKRINSM